MSRIVTFALVIALAAVGGCGNATSPPTAPAAEGAAVDSDRYLADTAEAADAVRAFANALGAIGSPATPERLKGAVTQLDPPLQRAQLAGQRLSAERLADRRLDEQRTRSAANFALAVEAMKRVRDAAAAGNAAAARTASTALAQALSSLSGTPAG